MFAARVEFRDQVGLGIHASIRDDPHLAVKCEGLVLAFGFERRPEQRMAEADVAVYPDPLFVWTAKSHEIRHPAKKRAVNGCTVEVDDADDSTHRDWPAISSSGDLSSIKPWARSFSMKSLKS